MIVHLVEPFSVKALSVRVEGLYVLKVNLSVTSVDTESERLAQKRVEDLIAASLYRARVNKIRESLRELYRGYELYLKPIEEVWATLAKEIPEEKTLSQEVVNRRRRETH